MQAHATPMLWILLLGIAATGAQAQADYPTRPLRLVSPSSAGGGSDIIARVIAPRLGERLGQQVIVENRPGAGTVIGSDHVAKAAPDGYTLLLGLSTLATNPALRKSMPYDAVRDLAPITQVAQSPNVLVVHPSTGIEGCATSHRLRRWRNRPTCWSCTPRARSSR